MKKRLVSLVFAVLLTITTCTSVFAAPTDGMYDLEDSSGSISYSFGIDYNVSSKGYENPQTGWLIINKKLDSSVRVVKVVLNGRTSGDYYTNGTGTRLVQDIVRRSFTVNNPTVGNTLCMSYQAGDKYFDIPRDANFTQIYFSIEITLQRGQRTWTAVLPAGSSILHGKEMLG